MDEITRLALACRSGDEAALTAFIHATQREVWRFCAHSIDPNSADDLAQETYLRAIRSIPRFRADASARTWLLSIAHRVCADHLRRLSRLRRSQARIVAQPSEAPAPDHANQVVLDDLLIRLEPDRRVAFVLTQILGYSYSDAADICHCPVGTIRSRVARARDDLINADTDAEAASPATGAT